MSRAGAQVRIPMLGVGIRSMSPWRRRCFCTKVSAAQEGIMKELEMIFVRQPYSGCE